MPDKSSPLSAADRESTFPVHIDLGKNPNESAVLAPMDAKGKKPKVYYPTLYLSDIPGLENLPESGCALIEYKRVRHTVTTPAEGDKSTSAELEIHTICLPEAGGAADETDDEDVASGMKKTAKKMGVDLGEEAAEAPAEAAGAEDDEDE